MLRSRITTDRTTEYTRCAVISLCGAVVWSEMLLFVLRPVLLMNGVEMTDQWVAACLRLNVFFFFFTRTPVYDSHFMQSV